MKKIFYLLFLLSAVLSLCLLTFVSCDGQTPSDQDSATSGSGEETPLPDPVEAIGLKYSVNRDQRTCTVTGMGTCRDPHILINESIDGYRVTAIGPYAFKNCDNLISVTLPSSVESIEKNAFAGCENLKEIVLPDSLLSIKKYAFENCKSLRSIHLPESLTSIGACAFKGCQSLTEITIPASVQSIEKDIFYKATNLSTVYYNSSYGNSGNDFLNTKSIRKIVFGGEIIPEFICKKCENLTDIVIEDTVKSIGGGAFFLCTSVKEITVPDSVTAIGYGAFSFCSSLIDITLPNGLTAISDSLFQNCSSLSGITIPESVSSIGMEAFLGCTALTSVKLPQALTHLDIGVFRDCSALTDITIPVGITKIPDEAFKNCSALTSIILPENLNSIGDWAFSHSNLKNIYFKGMEEAWSSVNKGLGWNNGMRDFEVICKTDDSENGDVTEDGTPEETSPLQD